EVALALGEREPEDPSIFVARLLGVEGGDVDLSQHVRLEPNRSLHRSPRHAHAFRWAQSTMVASRLYRKDTSRRGAPRGGCPTRRPPPNLSRRPLCAAVTAVRSSLSAGCRRDGARR